MLQLFDQLHNTAAVLHGHRVVDPKGAKFVEGGICSTLPSLQSAAST